MSDLTADDERWETRPARAGDVVECPEEPLTNGKTGERGHLLPGLARCPTCAGSGRVRLVTEPVGSDLRFDPSGEPFEWLAEAVPDQKEQT